MQPDSRKHLFDAQQAAAGVMMFTAGKTREDYESDLMLRLAVERQFEIIGEAPTRIRRLDAELLERISEHQRIIRFRNVLIHGYDSINNDIARGIVQEKLPMLRQELEELLK